MTTPHPLTYEDLDWLQLWRNARRDSGRQRKTAADWDKKAAGFADRNRTSHFIDMLVDRLPLTKEMTVLDIGCGPGTLTLPLARKVRRVTALDFSGNMLAILRDHARREQLVNIETRRLAWEDNWDDAEIDAHDIAIASRSLGVDDLPAALTKLNSSARRYVFIADRINPTPYAPEAYKAIGRPFRPGPDYIYTVNILYTMGIYPNIEILELPQQTRYQNLDEAITAYSWMLKGLSEKEKMKLAEFLAGEAKTEPDGAITIRQQTPLRWALIWWSISSPDYDIPSSSPVS